MRAILTFRRKLSQMQFDFAHRGAGTMGFQIINVASRAANVSFEFGSSRIVLTEND